MLWNLVTLLLCDYHLKSMFLILNQRYLVVIIPAMCLVVALTDQLPWFNVIRKLYIGYLKIVQRLFKYTLTTFEQPSNYLLISFERPSNEVEGYYFKFILEEVRIRVIVEVYWLITKVVSTV